MNGIGSIIGQILFIVSIIIIVIITYRLLKPFRYHRNRKWSTMMLKFSFLIYIAVFMVFVFWYIFVSKTLTFSAFNENTVSHLMNVFSKSSSSLVFQQENRWVYYILIIIDILLALPVLAILIRRKIKKRIWFNIIFTIVNFFMSTYLIYYLVSK